MIAITMSIVVLLQSVATTPPTSFCQRLARDLTMKPAKPVTGIPAYEINTARGIGAALFGGTFMTAMGVEPVGEATVADYQRANEACDPMQNGAVCRIDGPIRFKLSTKSGQVTQVAASAERARVEVVGTRIRCQDFS